MRIARASFLGLVTFLAACSGEGLDESGEPLGEVEEAVKSVCPPQDTVLGIDIASYQHPNGAAIDWATVAANRRFVIVKATEGTGYTNKYYADDVAKARAHGMIVGGYHWLHYTTSGAAQAQHFLDAVGGTVAPGDFPPMLDVEEVNDSATAAERVSIMKEWLDTIEAAIGRKPMIYSGIWYWGGSYMKSPLGFGDTYPMVWAAYTQACPKVPDDFTKLVMWQYLGGTGMTPGVASDCDQDKFYGTEAQLLALVNGGADYAGKSLGISGQSYPITSKGPVIVAQGQTVTGWVKLKNVGTKTWKPGSVWLAPIPRDTKSPFYSASWKSETRISTVKADVAPNEVGEFELDITGKDVGESILSLGWVAEGITWFSDPPKGGGPDDGYFAVKVNVVPSATSAVGAGGAGGSGGTTNVGGNGGAGGAADGAPVGDSAGCTCRVGSTPPNGSGVGSALLAFAGLLVGLRRRTARAS